ncbi:MAG: M15 family metallopeptidase [Lachnospiraceae bacterium]
MMILQSFGQTKHAEAAATASKNNQINYEYTPSSGSEDEEEWALILVNPWHSLPENYEVSLVQLNDEQSVDERCYPDLQQMMDDCRAAGLSPMICSSYRTVEKQEQLYNEKINELVAQGYSQEDAATEASQTIAVPGTSEHHLGLAIDLVDENHQVLDSSQEQTQVQQWLMKNSWKYGFILRFPNGKSDITGIIYEPWHYRYVGKTAAAEIYEKDICLEEYLGQADHTN